MKDFYEKLRKEDGRNNRKDGKKWLKLNADGFGSKGPVSWWMLERHCKVFNLCLRPNSRIKH